MTNPKPTRMFAAIRDGKIISPAMFKRGSVEDHVGLSMADYPEPPCMAWLRARKAGVRIVKVDVTIEGEK